MKDLLLGIDSGGSKTVLFLADADANIVFSAGTTGANAVDNRQWRMRYRSLVAKAHIFLPRIAHACISVGGYRESASIDAQVRTELEGCLGGIPLTIENDVYVAHDAAFLGEAGVLLIAGTGSMAVCRSTNGDMHRIGGFGPHFGDEGSAYWVGREALSLATLALDGRGATTQLTQNLSEALDLDQADGVTAFLEWSSNLSHPRSQISALSKIAFETADAGDPIATTLMVRAADHLSMHINAARELPGCCDASWSMLGGMRASASLISALHGKIGSHVDPKLPPWGGAIWRAALRTDWLSDPQWLGRLAKNLSIEMEPACEHPEKFEQGQNHECD